jgi:hypothetical protein
MKRTTVAPSITFTLPANIAPFISRFKQMISRPLARFNLRLPADRREMLPKAILVGLVIIVLTVTATVLRNASKAGDSRIQIKGAKGTQAINKEFSFPLKDKGKLVTTITYTIEAAELRDEIVVKGQRASSVKGRTFLIIPIKINNPYNGGIEIQTKDYIRLIVNGKEAEQLAADIHNDPVTVQALSTKQTRLGFPINDTDKNLSLRVGELNGEKETIALTLK